jgi:Skp family chaperone for outer membrane proteins
MIVLTAGMFFPRNAGAQDLKIATVDLEQLTLTSAEGKAVNTKVQKRYEEISTIMEKLQKEITDKENQLKTADRVMSATAKANLAKEIENLKISFDRKNQDYQKEITDYQNDLLDPVAAKAQSKLGAHLKDKNYSIVVDRSAEKGNLVWFNPANDITDMLIKELDEDYKKAAPAAATPARTPAAATPSATTPRAPATTTPAPAGTKN